LLVFGCKIGDFGVLDFDGRGGFQRKSQVKTIGRSVILPISE